MDGRADESIDALIERLRGAQRHHRVDPVMALPRVRSETSEAAQESSLPFARLTPGAEVCGARGLWMRRVEVRTHAIPVVVPEVVTCALAKGHGGPHASEPVHPWGGLRRHRIVLQRWE